MKRSMESSEAVRDGTVAERENEETMRLLPWDDQFCSEEVSGGLARTTQ